jgi:pimeloyl-ACP methyl ester carboxylesterase
MTAFPDPVHLTLSGANLPGGPVEPRVQLSIHDLAPDTAGDGNDRPPVVFCHGFPELAYSWRAQLPAVADAGFRAIAPDQRGYGGSSAPAAIADYGLGQLCGDLADMLDGLDVERAVFVGHDWGGFVAWAMPVLFPQRCAGVVGICTPYTPFPTTDFLKMMFGEDPETLYMLWFQEPGVAEAVLDPRARLVFEKLTVGGTDPATIAELGMARESGSSFNPFIDLEGLPAIGRPLLDPDELEVYASTFTRTGFRGGINWYRNIDANSAAYPGVGTQSLDLPSLMICAEWDPALPPALAAGMPNTCSDLEMHTVAEAGHWVQQEYPEQINELLVDWLTRRFPV